MINGRDYSIFASAHPFKTKVNKTAFSNRRIFNRTMKSWAHELLWR